MDDALALKGKTVSIRRTDAKLPKGQYFDAELEGCTVLDDATGEELGKLDKVLHYPAHKVYQVRGGAHEYLIPAVPGGLYRFRGPRCRDHSRTHDERTGHR